MQNDINIFNFIFTCVVMCYPKFSKVEANFRIFIHFSFVLLYIFLIQIPFGFYYRFNFEVRYDSAIPEA